MALTGNFKLIVLTNFEEPRPHLMADPGVLEFHKFFFFNLIKILFIYIIKFIRFK